MTGEVSSRKKAKTLHKSDDSLAASSSSALSRPVVGKMACPLTVYSGSPSSSASSSTTHETAPGTNASLQGVAPQDRPQVDKSWWTPTEARASMVPAPGNPKISLLEMLVDDGRKAGAYVERAYQDPPGASAPKLPAMPTTRAARVKAAAPPPVPPRVSADAATGAYEKFPWESTRQFQWRVFGVWRARGGQRQHEFKRRWKKICWSCCARSFPHMWFKLETSFKNHACTKAHKRFRSPVYLYAWITAVSQDSSRFYLISWKSLPFFGFISGAANHKKGIKL